MMKSSPFAALAFALTSNDNTPFTSNCTSVLNMKRIDIVKTGGFAPNDNLVVAQVDVPEPSEEEVLIDIKASAINPVDWKMAEWGFLLPKELPASLGCDIAGVVEDGPADMKGKRVATYLGADKQKTKTSRGAFAEKVLADKDVVFELPDDMSFAEAASQPVGALTAALLLNELTAAKRGDWVLIWGASSSVGFNTVQMAKMRGYKVVAVASSKHEATLTDLGADGFVDYRKDNVEAKVAEILKDSASKLNGAADCIGTADSFGTSAKLVKAHGETGAELAVSSVNSNLPEPPEGVMAKPVNLGQALDDKHQRKVIIDEYPNILKLKTQAIRSVKGKVTAETVQEALKINKDGVSGEKVVIEWED